MHTFTASFLCLIYFTTFTNALLLDLYSEKDRHGISIRLDVSDTECSNLPVSWAYKAASINTLGSCVQLYDEPFCKGSLTVIQPFHTIHQMDMSLINFANRIQSASACGPKIKTARYVIQNAADATILTVNSKFGGFARAFTTNTSTYINKGQQWEVIELSNSDYTLKPREFGDNFPVTFDEVALKKGQIKKKMWKLMSVGRGRYLIKNEPTQRCLYKTEENKVEEHDCRIWSPNQEWVFREIFGNQKSEKTNPSVGPGVNYNILSKVASYRPPTKPLPQFVPIYINASALAQVKRRTTAAPYIIRKKIKRGPRPKTKPIPLLNQLRPPGLRLRPALSDQLANNNKFLLLKHPDKLNKNVLHPPPEFVPSDDRVETYAYYQQIALAQAHSDAIRAKYPSPPLPPPFPPGNQKQSDEISKIKKKKKKKDDDDEANETEEEDELKNDEDEENNESEEEEEEEEKSDDEQRRPEKLFENNFATQNNLGPQYNYNGTNALDKEESTSFLSSVYSKVKTGLGSVTSMSLNVPFLSTSNKQNSSLIHSPQEGTWEYSHTYKDYSKYPSGGPKYPNLYRPHRVQLKSEKEIGHKPGLRLPKRKSSTTTTTLKPKLWSFFG